MTGTAEEIVRAARQLAPEDLDWVLAQLLGTLDAEEDEGVEEAWAEEIERRVQRLAAGQATLLSWVEVKELAERRRSGDG